MAVITPERGTLHISKKNSIKFELLRTYYKYIKFENYSELIIIS